MEHLLESSIGFVFSLPCSPLTFGSSYSVAPYLQNHARHFVMVKASAMVGGCQGSTYMRTYQRRRVNITFLHEAIFAQRALATLALPRLLTQRYDSVTVIV